ncbi:MAG: hypothetical protein OES53_03180 [Xanthomonadales bacterium]|jgi:hypothetical protein|nr:hypothetical protein [Xanthomonadales bacterium]MDH3923336.1 hypothetical protein [Xanthomonadales bacterium]MDH3940122.1 hypothetical protein [Xanthomonadales bacterium]MDH4000308.1 hypothetical protein [Xanthomonadales bacterium]
MKRLTIIAAACAAAWAVSAPADWTEAACEIYPIGEDHTDVLIPCTFSQRQGYITLTRDDGVTHDLSPVSETPGNFKDQDGRMVYRQRGLGDQGLIFRFPDESVYVYWNTKMLEPEDESSPTWPFTTDEYDATTLLSCKSEGDPEFGNCPAGILRMENNQASIVVQNQMGEQFTINFMTDYVNATNREVEAQLEGDMWILHFANGEIWEVPIAAIEGG